MTFTFELVKDMMVLHVCQILGPLSNGSACRAQTDTQRDATKNITSFAKAGGNFDLDTVTNFDLNLRPLTHVILTLAIVTLTLDHLF